MSVARRQLAGPQRHGVLVVGQRLARGRRRHRRPHAALAPRGCACTTHILRSRGRNERRPYSTRSRAILLLSTDLIRFAGHENIIIILIVYKHLKVTKTKLRNDSKPFNRTLKMMINKHLHKISTSNSFVPMYTGLLNIESNPFFPKHLNGRESVLSCAAKSGVEFLIVFWSVLQLIMVSIPCHEQPFINCKENLRFVERNTEIITHATAGFGEPRKPLRHARPRPTLESMRIYFPSQ